MPGLLVMPNPAASLKLLLLLDFLLPDARLLALLLMLAERARCAIPLGAGSGCSCGSGVASFPLLLAMLGSDVLLASDPESDPLRIEERRIAERSR